MLVMPSKLWRFEWSGGGTVKEKIEEIKSILFNESLFAFFLHLYYYFKEVRPCKVKSLVGKLSGLVGQWGGLVG